MNKNISIRNIIKSLFVVGITLLGTVSCDDNNDWSVDDNKNQMFSPVLFESARTGATYVDLRFSKVTNAQSYIIEISQDSLEFNSIISTHEVLAEQVVDDTTSTSKNVYLTSIKKLEPETRYSARMKVTSDKDIPESRWVETTFKTTSEQILDAVSAITANSATLTWEAGLDVTHVICVGNLKKEDLKLTTQNISEGNLVLTGLAEYTNYIVEIYNNEKKRGARIFQTEESLPEGSISHKMTGTEDIVSYLDGITDERVTLVIPEGVSFDIAGSWTLPAHIKELNIWGEPVVDQAQAKIIVKEIKLDASVSEFKFRIHNMNIEGTDPANDYVMNDNPSTARKISEFKIDKSTVSNVRGVFRMRSVLTVDKIDIDNCIIHTIGSYGILSVDNEKVVVKDIEVKNSTIYKVTNTNAFTFKSKADQFKIYNCTFYDAIGKDKYLANFNGAANAPGLFGVLNCIIANSSAVEIRGTNPKNIGEYAVNSYKTTEITVNTGYPMGGLLEYNNTSDKLFQDPTNADFRIIDRSIGGDRQPGDPRWW